MAVDPTETVFIQTQLGVDGDVGISPVLLQAVNQTLDLKTTRRDETVGLVVTDGDEAIVHQVADNELSAQTVIIESNEETVHPGSSHEDETSLMATSSPNKTADGHLVIKVIGDNFGDAVNQAAIMNQLRQKLGIKVVVQMENADGEVVFEDTVTPNHTIPVREMGQSSMMIEDESSTVGDKENEDVNAIVKSVVNTIRDLSSKLGRVDMKPCPVCGDTITGYHYAVQTCESCKGFFKRTVQNKKTHTCHRGGTCDISVVNRKKCAACRFQKCCDVGMKIEGVREDRSRGGRSKYYGPPITFTNKRASVDPISMNMPIRKTLRLGELPGTNFQPSQYSQPTVPQIMQELFALESIYEEQTADPLPCCENKLTACDTEKFSSMLHLTEHRLHQIVRWARHLPNFLEIEMDDQILLLKNAWAELVSLGAIWRSRFNHGVIKLSFGKTLDLQKAREMEHEEVISRMLHVCTNFRRIDVDKYEYVTLKALALMLPDIKGLKNINLIQKYQNRLLDALMVHTATRYPNSPTKFGELLLRLSEIQRHTAVLRKQILTRLNNGEIPEYHLTMALMRGQRDLFSVLPDENATHIVVTEETILDM